MNYGFEYLILAFDLDECIWNQIKRDLINGLDKMSDEPSKRLLEESMNKIEQFYSSSNNY